MNSIFFFSSSCLLFFFSFISLNQSQSVGGGDSYLVGGWQSVSGSSSGSTDYFVFNSDGTFSALLDNAALSGTYSSNQNQNPWWLDLKVQTFGGKTVPALYSHPSSSSSSSSQNKQLYLSLPSNHISMFTGTAQRPTDLTNATLFVSTSFIPSFTTSTTTTTGAQTTGFGGNGGTTWTNCSDCQDACRDTCNLAQVGRKRCQKKCQKMLCSKVC
eukprot:TRINITY_DN688_c0_g2_i1.p1 TRINITY_DN688_c0_g2~~TRINITY_DN688_c0_g2_i1.p1  ORF type:complete len:214 (+),score=78.80 TRINITY_DN688_c0_g2_i1:86-727(+)